MRMKGIKRGKRRWLFLFLVFVAFVYVNNSSYFAQPHDSKPLLLAHRGLAQTFDLEGVTNDTCTATRIHKPEHPYLENTLPSMEAAFLAGADLVEFDVKPTKDGQFAVFHDWTLDCRTNGQGTASDYTMAELKQLDVGYGYTYDGGKTYPFRGKGVGLMPSMEEVLARFPDKSFLIHIKSNDPAEGELLARHLTALPEQRLAQLTVYGGDEPIAALKEKLPAVRVMSMATMKSGLIPYMLIGWTGYVPDALRHTQVHIPEKIAPWLWGFPHRFQERMDRADTRIVLVGGDGSEFSSGFDTAEDVKRLPSDFSGVIWTNRIDRIAPLYGKK